MIYTPAMQQRGRLMQQQCLFMDNCSVHTTADVWNAMLDSGFQFEFFPPNCTPILQPCDMNVNREFKRVWTSCWLDWFIEYGSTPANWTRCQNPRKADEAVVHQWIARCMQAMTEKTVRDSWNRSVFAVWWWFMVDRTLFGRIVHLTAAPNSDEWKMCWLMYELYARRLLSATGWSMAEASVSVRSRKKAESKEEHDRRLDSYAEMERKRRERYDASLLCDSDEEDDEKDEKQQLIAEELVEQLDECVDMEAEQDKENQPPETASSSGWESDCLMVQRMAEEAELRRQRKQ